MDIFFTTRLFRHCRAGKWHSSKDEEFHRNRFIPPGGDRRWWMVLLAPTIYDLRSRGAECLLENPPPFYIKERGFKYKVDIVFYKKDGGGLKGATATTRYPAP
jgi:hypothetical protein